MSTANARRKPARDPFDVSHLVAEAAERQVLAGVLVNLDRDPATSRAIMAELSPDMMYGDATGPLFAVVHRVLAETSEPSRADVLAGLHRAGHVQGTDVFNIFVDAVTEYAGMEPQSARLARAAVVEVRETFERRQLMHQAELVARSGGRPDDITGMIRQLERVQSASGAAAGNGPLTVLDIVDAWARNERQPAVPTGLHWFDGPTEGGLPVGGIVALVAYPQVGKTALALQLTLAALVHDRTMRAVWGMGEMPKGQMGQRMACVAAALLPGCEPVTMSDARRRTPAARAANVALCEAIGDRLSVIPAPLTVDAIEARVVATGARLVVVDYLQLIRSPDKTTDRVHELDRIIGRIRDMAIQRECAAIVISSMAKAAGTTSRIGQFGKGSGEIDYAVEMLYVGQADERDGRPVVGDDGTVGVVWQCKKARNLEQRDLQLRFDGDTQTYDAAGFDEFSSFAPRPGL